MHFKNLLSTCLFFFLFSSCGDIDLLDQLSSKKTQPVITQEVMNADGIKYISPYIDDARDPSSYFQSSYQLNSEGRLLVRFENFSLKKDDILSDENYRVFFDIKLADTLNSKEIYLCPLESNWMILATWYHSHPLSGGSWSNPGGDYNDSECILGKEQTKLSEQLKLDQNVNKILDENRIVFDITNWVITELKGSRRNFGWLLKTNDDVKVMGETDSAVAPRTYWSKIAD